MFGLDAETGELAWETPIFDYTEISALHNSGPIIADGKAISGRSCGRPEAWVIVAHDARTGEELGRRRTIPTPGEPGDETWGRVPFEERRHVGTWMSLRYDPELRPGLPGHVGDGAGTEVHAWRCRRPASVPQLDPGPRRRHRGDRWGSHENAKRPMFIGPAGTTAATLRPLLGEGCSLPASRAALGRQLLFQVLVLAPQALVLTLQAVLLTVHVLVPRELVTQSRDLPVLLLDDNVPRGPARMGTAPRWRVCGAAGPRPSSIDTTHQDLYPQHADSCPDAVNEDPGTGPLAAAALLAEVGDDMEAFGTARRLASWAGICPGNHELAGKSKGGKRRKGNVYLRRILCEVAHAAARTRDVQFGPYKQHLAKPRGAGRAVVATAHKILRIVFAMLRDGKPYHDPQIDYQGRTAIRNKARWQKMLRKANLLQEIAKEAVEQLRTAPEGGRAGPPPSGAAPEPAPA